MCTAVSYKTRDHYFGRNLDVECSYHEKITITPRNYPFSFRKGKEMESHYAMIGVANVDEQYPLYFDATNEKGLSMAGLNFPGFAEYKPEQAGKDNITPFEFIPWILGQCATILEARQLLEQINLVNIPFNSKLPLAKLHWIISDENTSITVESVKEGLRIYENPVGVLTNTPSFDMQLFHLNNYMYLSTEEPDNHFSDKLKLKAYCRGMGALGLPGDMSSMSRFVKASFVKLNSVSGDSESESISQFFHILDAVAQYRGCVDLGNEQYEYTLYTSCCNTTQGVYYYKTYENSQITAIDMHKENLEGRGLVIYPLIKGQQIRIQN